MTTTYPRLIRRVLTKVAATKIVAGVVLGPAVPRLAR